jgi:hypothetical protein
VPLNGEAPGAIEVNTAVTLSVLAKPPASAK